jgi:hypothetical protein
MPSNLPTRLLAFTAFVAAIAIPATQLMAAVIPPIGLAPRSQYQLIVVTADTVTATSANVFDYDTFVQHEAGQSFLPPASLSAVVATPTTNANIVAPSNGYPVYNTQGISATIY